MFDEDDDQIIRELHEKKRRKSFTQMINKRDLSSFEMDDWFTEE